MAVVYERLLVPMIFQPYAGAMAARVAAFAPERVLEIAAGTGVVTRALAAWLPESTAIVATDLSDAMLQVARAQPTARPVSWRQADAMELPFANESFDAVVCQFGVMFFPDKARAFAEVHRVLAPGGRFFFSAWDRIEDNDIPFAVAKAVAGLFADDPPTFLSRIPHGYHDVATIRADLSAGGFGGTATVDTIYKSSRANAPSVPAIAFCQGTPLRSEIEARGGSIGEATDVATRALVECFGDGAVDGQIKAHIVVVAKH